MYAGSRIEERIPNTKWIDWDSLEQMPQYNLYTPNTGNEQQVFSLVRYKTTFARRMKSQVPQFIHTSMSPVKSTNSQVRLRRYDRGQRVPPASSVLIIGYE